MVVVVWNLFIEILIELHAVQFCCLHVRSVGLGRFTSCVPINFRTLPSQKKCCALSCSPPAPWQPLTCSQDLPVLDMSQNVLTWEVGLCAGSFLSVLAFTD